MSSKMCFCDRDTVEDRDCKQPEVRLGHLRAVEGTQRNRKMVEMTPPEYILQAKSSAVTLFRGTSRVCATLQVIDFKWKRSGDGLQYQRVLRTEGLRTIRDGLNP